MGQPRESWMTRPHHHLIVLLAAAALVLAAATEAPGQPTGEAVMAWHVTIAPTWFDPSTAPPQITPFGILFALHDALVRPLPNQKMGNSLAESWTESPDGLVYEFKLRRGVKFHNGDALTAEDVKFSFERYKGTGAKELQARVESVEIADPLTVRFRLKAAWPDFMTFYGTTATAAGIVVPKKYMEKVGDEGFRKHPIGAGPYKFVSHMPGVEVVLEAYTGYWRRVPNVKRLIMKSVPEGTTRVAMLKKGEADIAYALDGQEAEDVRRDPRLLLVATRHASIFWIEFADQWDPKSPWHDKRLRLAVNHALNRKAINEAACLGFCPPAAVIVPRVMDYALQVEPPAYDPQKARQLLVGRRVRADSPLLHGGGRRDQRPEGRGNPREDAAGGARDLLRRMAGEEVARDLPDRGRQLRQRGQPRGSVHVLQGELLLRRLPGHRRAVPAAGSGAGLHEA